MGVNSLATWKTQASGISIADCYWTLIDYSDPQQSKVPVLVFAPACIFIVNKTSLPTD